MPVRVSAAMIVRDEEQFLGDCLTSLAGQVDEIVVVDTGSEDRTIEIARAHGARVFTIPWPDDFAAARNSAIERATGDWILWIDADDRLQVPEGMRLSELLDDPKAAGARVRMQWSSGVTDCGELRLFRNDPRIRFVGVVHETVNQGLQAVCRADRLVIRDTPVRITHLGYEGDRTPKHRRNLPLLRRAVQDQPGEAMSWSRLAEALAPLGEAEEAIEACRKAIAIFRETGSVADRAGARLAYAILVPLLTEGGKPVRDLLQVIEEGLSCTPDDYGLLLARARTLIEIGRYAEALAILERFTATGREASETHPVGYDMRFFGEFAHDQRGIALMRLGRFEEAAEAFEKAAAAAPDDLAYRAKAAAMRGHAARLARAAS